MPRYSSVPATKAYTIHTEDGVSFAPSLYVDDKEVTWTGLIDEIGNPICRVQDPIGFDIERATSG